jgi:hypothetical protein
LETEQGEVIEVLSEGLRSASPDVLARLGAGEQVVPSEYYFRTSIRLSTASLRLAGFNHRLYIGVGERQKGAVQITVFEVP